MSKVLTDQIEKRTGGTAMDLPATGKWPTANIADDAIGADQLAGNSVVSASIVDGAIVNADINASADIAGTKLADNAVTLAKMEDGTQGDILYYGASGAPTRLAKGTAAQVLKINSGATAPEWGTDSGGGLKLISDNDFVGTASHFDVTDCFSATYRSYLIVMDMICVQTETAHPFLKLGNSDLSSTESASWSLQMLGVNGTTDYKAVGSADASGQRLVHQQHNSNMGFSGILWVHNPYGSGAGYICYTHGTGEVYANGTAEGFWFTRYGASHGVNSIVSMRLTASGGMGYSGITGHVLIYGLSES